MPAKITDIKSKEIVFVRVDEIKPNPRNRNKHSEEQIERLAKIIDIEGFRNPLIISNQTGLLIAGHGRLEAAKRRGYEVLPAIFQDFENVDQEYRVMTADNAITSWAELDLININLDIQELGPFDIDLLGIKDFVIEPLEKLEIEDNPIEHVDNKFILKITFPNEMEMMDVHDDLLSRGYLVKIEKK